VVLPVTRQMSQAGRGRFAGLRSLHAPEVLGAIVAAAARGNLWVELLPLARLLPPAAQAVVWSEIVAVAEDLSAARRGAMASRALDLGIEDMLDGLVTHVLEAGLLPRGLRLVAQLGPAPLARLAPFAAALPADQRAAILHRARALRLVRKLGPLVAALAGPPAADG
jgi:hypothetical protein